MAFDSRATRQPSVAAASYIRKLTSIVMIRGTPFGETPMAVSPLAGKPAPRDLLIDVGRLLGEYASRRPDPADPRQRVSFGTSGHRGTPQDGTFTEAHIVAITQAICDYRARQ